MNTNIILYNNYKGGAEFAMYMPGLIVTDVMHRFTQFNFTKSYDNNM